MAGAGGKCRPHGSHQLSDPKGQSGKGPFHSRGGAQLRNGQAALHRTRRHRPAGKGRRGEQSRAILASWPGAPFSPGSPCKTEQSLSWLCGIRTRQITRPSSRQTFSLKSRLSKDNDRWCRQTRTPQTASGQAAQGRRGRKVQGGDGAFSPGLLDSARTASGGSCRGCRAVTGSLPGKQARSGEVGHHGALGSAVGLPGSNPGSSAPWLYDSEQPFVTALSSLCLGFFTRNMGIGAEPCPQVMCYCVSKGMAGAACVEEWAA